MAESPGSIKLSYCSMFAHNTTVLSLGLSGCLADAKFLQSGRDGLTYCASCHVLLLPPPDEVFMGHALQIPPACLGSAELQSVYHPDAMLLL